MEESVELRFWKKNAQLLLRDNEGELLADLVRRVVLPGDDPRLKQIGPLSQRLRAEGDALLSYWRVSRKYTAAEIAAAKVFLLEPTAMFEPAGEECGTVYDDSTACPACAAGRRQVSDLRLKTGKLPKSKDIAITISRVEWIISTRLADLLVLEGVTGFELRPVLECNGKQTVPDWRQLWITSQPVSVAPPTRFGVSPFGDQPEDKAACPLGDTRGMRLLSELYIRCDSWDGSDFVRTAQFVGHRLGLIMPHPLVLVSPKLFKLLKEHRIKGFDTEVAYCE